ncbi:UPF0182 family protein [Desulfosarcina sp.]|uniref:UPF0182 family membrane protein n=1 Tax=Desulfosarcina sp. TaxID=2027861 RepID=UPI003970822A
MQNASNNDFPRGQLPQFRPEDLDFKKVSSLAKWIGLGLAVFALWNLLSWAMSFYRDWLWFSNLEHQSVLLKVMSTRIWLFLLGSAVFLAVAIPNLLAVFRTTPRTLPTDGSEMPPDSYRIAITLLIWLGWAAVAVGAVLMATRLAAEWELFLRFFNGVPFNETEPIFNRDFSFYIFTLPAVTFLRTWLLSVLVVIGIGAAALYYLASSLRGERFSLSPAIRSHLALMGAFIFLLIAAGHWLGRYDLLYSPTGAVYGVGYTDHYVTMPARFFLTFVALACSGMLFFSRRFKNPRIDVYAVIAWVGLTLVFGSVLPALVQRLHVEPSELARETDYLANNIAFTRNAYGLTDIQSRSHPAQGKVDEQAVADNQGTIQNIRLWDEGPLLQSYNQIQFFRLYYDFMAVHTDRYRVDGQLRQVMLATRELSAEKLPAEAQRWVNRHLQFTHGYGVAMTPVTEVDRGGRPGFFIKDVPPAGAIPLTRPDIYYGLKSLDFLIVRSGMQEFNYPGPDGPAYVRYEGKGGVQLSSFFRRLIYSIKFMDVNILISGEIASDSRIQYRRTVPERFATVTPFLMRDQEAYAVVADGRLFWIQDAYTFTRRYPYATPYMDSFNYIRNSVKAVVDAYHGTIDYYVADPSDPMIMTYQAIFPGLFKPLEEMPGYLKEHLRYPLDLFTIQSQMLLQYHMEDHVVFYNKEDQWSIPVQSSFGQTQALKPYYIVARLPGEEKEEFLLIQPFTPSDRHNLVGWIAARSDGEHYGKMELFRFPSGRHVDGPNQVEARIDNDAVISEQFTLWGQVGSEVFRGILLVVPIGDAVLYAEPVFLKPEALDFPELRRIILADSHRVVMQQTLDSAINDLTGRPPGVEADPSAEEKAAASTPSGLIVQGIEEIHRILQEATGRLQELINQLRQQPQEAEK